MPVTGSCCGGAAAAPLGFYGTLSGVATVGVTSVVAVVGRRSTSGGQHAGLPRYFFSFSPPFPPQF